MERAKEEGALYKAIYGGVGSWDEYNPSFFYFYSKALYHTALLN